MVYFSSDLTTYMYNLVGVSHQRADIFLMSALWLCIQGGTCSLTSHNPFLSITGFTIKLVSSAETEVITIADTVSSGAG